VGVRRVEALKQAEQRRVEALKEAEARQVKARKAAALSDLLVGVDDVEELRSRTEAGWGVESDHAQLQARTVRVYEEALARAQRMLATARATENSAELRLGVEAARTASPDTLCAMAVQAAAAAGVFANEETIEDDAEEEEEEDALPRWKRFLMTAAEEGYVETIRAMVAAGVDVNPADDDGWTALIYTAVSGQVETMRMLLEAGAEVDHTTNDGESALLKASANGHAEAVRMLLEAGAEVGGRWFFNDGWTALHAAAENGHAEVMRMLLEAGADIDQANNEGITPRAVVQASNHEAVVFLVYGAAV
jgi:hypothetical protein